MTSPSSVYEMQGRGLRLVADLVPWDTKILGSAVARIGKLALLDPSDLAGDYSKFKQWLDSGEVGLVSCRLRADRLPESIFLEAQGFRFIEMVLHPTIENVQSRTFPSDVFAITWAREADLPVMRHIAEHAFAHERFHADPRLSPSLGNLRYGQWVESSLHHPRQQLLKVVENEDIVALFVVEEVQHRAIYWHLTAVAPERQGMGYGYRVWNAVLSRHRMEGCDCVTTTISACNVPVLNLYAKLNARFLPPEMTFHWVREAP